MSKVDPKIGIVGGAGPYAGLDCAKKILHETIAEKDQDYLPTLLVSTPELIEDRTKFLLGEIKDNPAYAILSNIIDLRDMGATVVGIPCNTAHAPSIKNVFMKKIEKLGCEIKVLDMISEIVIFLKKECPEVKNVGVLSTVGTWEAGFFPEILGHYGYHVFTLSKSKQRYFHNEALYHPEHGIKVKTDPVTKNARNILLAGFESLKKKGAEAIILGCTEIPLGIPERKIDEIFCIDTSLVLARALINEFKPEKLVPWSWHK